MHSGNTNGGEMMETEIAEFLLMNVEEMAYPASDWEAATLAEVLAFPRVVVTRPPEAELLAIDMRRNDCHVNCATQEANDPERRSRHVSGWYISGSDLVLHSVVDIAGHWYCLTPQFGRPVSRFDFIPDPAIEWRDSVDGDSREPFRNGRRLPLALRTHPSIHIGMRDEFRRLMAAGLSVLEARDKVDVTLGARYRTLGFNI